MISFDKESFLLLLKVRPKGLLGKQIMYKRRTVGIIDISVSGDYLYIEDKSNNATEWVPASSLEDHVIVDMHGIPTGTKMFTAVSITRSIETLENLVGQPGSEQSKPLFEIVASLNKEMFELGQKVDGLENIREMIKLYNQATAELRQKIEEIELKLQNIEKD